MNSALSRLINRPADVSAVSTDGEYYYYNPFAVIQGYKYAKEFSCRQYLHSVFHCIYRHMFIGTFVHERYWNIACDIAVENSVNELQLDNTFIPQQTTQQDFIRKLNGKVKYITAEVIYHYFLNNNPPESTLKNMERLFSFDDHSLWYKKENQDSGNNRANQGNQDNQNNQDNQDNQDNQNSQNNNDFSHRKELEEIWKDVSQYIQTALETIEQERGTQSGGLTQNLLEVNRERYDYTAFLKKFAVMSEAMKINDDEFDYIFYTYGLQIYKKMPLIEPLEYKDVRRIKEFVIAIDTSGSVSGELVQKFVQKTYNILKSTESFFAKINLHIIQCDAEIQKDVKITSQEEFDNYLSTMILHGFGGTDFRPVFRYVEKLIEQREFTNLKGLIYFTDGFGVFPERKPDYDVAFVYIDDEYNNPEVPVWAIKLILQSEEI